MTSVNERRDPSPKKDKKRMKKEQYLMLFTNSEWKLSQQRKMTGGNTETQTSTEEEHQTT